VKKMQTQRDKRQPEGNQKATRRQPESNLKAPTVQILMQKAEHEHNIRQKLPKH
jgi:hypothetical protein